MKKYILLLTIITISICRATASFCGTLDELRGKLNEPSDTEAPTKKVIFDIQKIFKDKVTGWVWTEGGGTRSILAITVKFKIRKKGDGIKIPHLYVYLFDREKNRIKKIDSFFYKTPTGPIKGSSTDSFKGNKTYQLQFPYSIEDKFRYAIAIVGNNKDCAFATLHKNTSIDDFEFKEKHLVK